MYKLESYAIFKVDQQTRRWCEVIETKTETMEKQKLYLLFDPFIVSGWCGFQLLFLFNSSCLALVNFS